MRFLCGILFFLYSVMTFAQEATLPASCENTGFESQDKQLVLKGDYAAPRVFILHNRSNGVVIMNHIVSSVGGRNDQSRLDPGKWSLVSPGSGDFPIGCIFYTSGHIGYQDCLSVLSVCSVPTKTSMGSSWIVQSDSLSKVLEILKIQGVSM